jgi:hypothetical protein
MKYLCGLFLRRRFNVRGGCPRDCRDGDSVDLVMIGILVADCGAERAQATGRFKSQAGLSLR